MEYSDRSISDSQPPPKELRVVASTRVCSEQDGRTVDVNLREVPEFLRCGEYYRSFQDGEMEEPCDVDNKSPISHSVDSQTKDMMGENPSITVPLDCYKTATTIIKPTDLYHLLSTLRFWLVDVLPDSVIAYALDGDTGRTFSAVAEPFMNDMPKLEVLRILGLSKNRSTRLIVAMKANASEEIVEYLFEHCKDESPLNAKVANTAVELGSLKYLQCVHDQGYPWTQTTCSRAAANGHLHCLKYAHEQGCPWNSSTNIQAAKGGHLDCMKFAIEHGCPFDRPSVKSALDATTWSAASCGHLDCLQYAHQHGASLYPNCSTDAAKGGHVDCLQYTLYNGCSCDFYTMLHAIQSRSLECVTLVRDQGCQLNTDILAVAAIVGNLGVLKYLHREGCPWGASLCAYTAEAGNLDCLQYLHEQGCPWGEDTTLEAAANGHTSCLEYAITQGCPMRQDICTIMFAIYPKTSKIDSLQYLHHLGFQVDAATTSAAKYANDTQCLKYLASIENHCPLH